MASLNNQFFYPRFPNPQQIYYPQQDCDYEEVVKNFDPATFFQLSPSLFNQKGNLRYANTEPLELVRGRWRYYTPYRGWIRYGLDIEKFGASGSNWLGSDGNPGEWAVGFHGLRRDVIDVIRRISVEGFRVFHGKNSDWGSNSIDMGPNADSFPYRTCGKGVFLTSSLKCMTSNVEDCRLLKPIQYNNYYYIEVALQCRIRPRSIRMPECSGGEYYIINDPLCVRPYGILIRFIPWTEAKTILEDNNYNLEPALPLISADQQQPDDEDFFDRYR